MTKMECRRLILQVFVLATAVVSVEMQEGSDKGPVGILDNIIIKILESLKPKLENFKTGFQAFETGDQEFGNFRGYFNEVTVEGLDKFRIDVLKTSLLDLKNLTIVEEKINASGWYKINGTLAFPMGKNDIHLFGDGPFWAEFHNFSISLKFTVRSQDGLYVKDLDIIIALQKINVRLMNLMNGGELQDIFNQLINDLGLTVINYYKEPILEVIKPQIKEFIDKMLNGNKLVL